LRLGIPLEFPAAVLSPALAELDEACPEAKVQVRQLPSAQQLAALRAGELDVGLVRERPAGEQFDAMLVIREELGGFAVCGATIDLIHECVAGTGENHRPVAGIERDVLQSPGQVLARLPGEHGGTPAGVEPHRQHSIVITAHGEVLVCVEVARVAHSVLQGATIFACGRVSMPAAWSISLRISESPMTVMRKSYGRANPRSLPAVWAGLGGCGVVAAGDAAGDALVQREVVVHLFPGALAVAGHDRFEHTVVGAGHVELGATVGGEELTHAEHRPVQRLRQGRAQQSERGVTAALEQEHVELVIGRRDERGRQRGAHLRAQPGHLGVDVR
jgi:LysR substrate binding domain